MFATEFPPILIPSWVERVALPKYPIMPLAAFILLGTGALLLLIGYFTPIKKLPALLAALAWMAYYPLSYLALWFLFRFDEDARALGEPNKLEAFLFNHTHVMGWSILGLCAFFGFVFFVWTMWATVRKYRRMPDKETPSPPSLVVERAVPRPAMPPAPQVKKVSKNPPAPPSDKPFNRG